MKLHGKRGFTILAVLVIATVLYSLLSLTLASGYALHRRNTRLKHALQQRSRSSKDAGGGLSKEPGGTRSMDGPRRGGP